MIEIIVAFSQNGVIGNRGVIPWNIPGEKQLFLQHCQNKAVIMGRKTYEEINHPLPNSLNIILSRSISKISGCSVADSLQSALLLANKRDIVIAGGEEVYKEALPIADLLILTRVECQIKGDRYFPNWDRDDFVFMKEEFVPATILYTRMYYKRKEKKNECFKSGTLGV